MGIWGPAECGASAEDGGNAPHSRCAKKNPKHDTHLGVLPQLRLAVERLRGVGGMGKPLAQAL